MLKRVLIANRGEIACRIIRTARRMGIATVAVYSDADRHALHVAQADVAVHIGPSPALDSYLRIDKVLAAARETGADSVHPGYGFLAENADFADACAKARIKFIGPSGDAMRKLGGKAAAKIIARAAGVPVVPGYDGDVQDVRTLQKEAGRIGYPVMIKAVAGGGGRGMRLVEKADDFAAALESAQREAQSSFGDARVLVEKLVVRPRHIEVQVFGDSHGNVVHLFERDCSLQRRNQKVIEEAPAPGMSEALRKAMTDAAVRLGKAVGYEGAGTVEFLVEGGELKADAPWHFIEMNTRLQVEHPVTEEITGLDLVEWQFRVAAGEKLPKSQGQITMRGHAIEARLCAEDPSKGFMPSIGRIVSFEDGALDGIRLESGVRAGDEISPFYDSMIAKLIGAGDDRAAALRAVIDGLSTLVVAGPRTNARFLRNLLALPDVRAGRMDTGLIARDLATLTDATVHADAVSRGVVSLLHGGTAQSPGQGEGWTDPWTRGDAFQLGGSRRLTFPVVIADAERQVSAIWEQGDETIELPVWDDLERRPAPGAVAVRADGAARILVIDDLLQVEIRRPEYDTAGDDNGHAGDSIRAPINGKVVKVFVAEGQAVAKGERIAVVEAMKMEHVLHAARDGTVGKLAVKEGQQVNQGALIAALVEEGAVVA
ncbi:MAG: biotin carboxylase N-terminal domain-containing protein [Hyphomicrobiaceae bacterium]